MILIKEPQLTQIIAYTKKVLGNDKTGHSMDHIERVVELAKTIQLKEGGDLFIVLAGAYLHDVLDDKLVVDVLTERHKLARFLASLSITDKQMAHIFEVIDHVSFSQELESKEELSLEAMIVQDADRLDALGAIGIARTFYYGGQKGHEMHQPSIPPREAMTKVDYRDNQTVLNHFYEKLFKLEGLMKTQTGKQLAQDRTLFMRTFVDQFLKEWK
ncbi:MAG: HD domain-containing protein [Vagococcus sp.]